MHLHIKREVLGPLIFTIFVCLPFFLPSFFLSLPLSLPSSPSFFPNLNLSIQKQPGCVNLILTSLALTNEFLIHLKNIGNYFSSPVFTSHSSRKKPPCHTPENCTLTLVPYSVSKSFVDISSQHLRTVSERLNTICTKQNSLLPLIYSLVDDSVPRIEEPHLSG